MGSVIPGQNRRVFGMIEKVTNTRGQMFKQTIKTLRILYGDRKMDEGAFPVVRSILLATIRVS